MPSHGAARLRPSSGRATLALKESRPARNPSAAPSRSGVVRSVANAPAKADQDDQRTSVGGACETPPAYPVSSNNAQRSLSPSAAPSEPPASVAAGVPMTATVAVT